jgi:hypothetical protein
MEIPNKGTTKFWAVLNPKNKKQKPIDRMRASLKFLSRAADLLVREER